MVRATSFSIDEADRVAASRPINHINHLVACSDGLDWHNLYGSLAVEAPWEAMLAPVNHDCYVYCLNGPAVLHRSIDGGRSETATLFPRQFCITPRRRVARLRIDGQPTILVLYLHGVMMDNVAKETLGIDHPKVELIPRFAFFDPLLEQLALSVLDVMERRAQESVLYVDYLATTMALQLLLRHSALTHCRAVLVEPASDVPKKQHSASLRHVRAYLKANLGGNLTLDVLAREAGMSTDHFFRAFTRYFGTPPHRYVLERRIEWARQLLQNSDQPLADIAIQTGFSSQSHLSSAFKRLVGVTPAVYRLCRAR